jgi:hypothetical protein
MNLMIRRTLLGTAFAAIIATTTSPSQAAPQILAALPLHSGIELTCQGGVCAAQLTTYCLQRERPSPTLGTAYVPAKPEHFTLVLQSDDGKEVRLPAGEHMRFIENRGFMSVAASLETARLIALGAKNAKLVVWEGASLIPVPIAGDPDPLAPEEIAYVTDSLRDHGKQYVDNLPQASAAQLLAQLNSALPHEGFIQPSGFKQMWQQAIGDEVPLPTGPALGAAEKAYGECTKGQVGYRNSGLKNCLEYKHDNLIRDLNIDYWENQPGS